MAQFGASLFVVQQSVVSQSIEYMQDTIGTKPSKWCGGCHDPALLYAGKMDTPIKQIVHTPEAQAGLGCMMCHSIARVKSTMGQADFYLEYPAARAGGEPRIPFCGLLHDFVIKLNPEPHRRVFLKPFMKQPDGGILLFMPQSSSRRAGE